MLRRLHHEQPDSFAFTEANQAWAEAQVTKFPEGRQASAIIPLLWRAHEQEGWLTRPAMEYVAGMLGMPFIRALEVASFYFMFKLQPVGSVANIQICGTTSCMICGAEDLIGVCREKIAPNPHELSADGKFSWEEVECLGACANAPMAQIGKDYYEDLTVESLRRIIDELAAGKVPLPGPQNGRYTSEPKSGLTSLKDHEAGRKQYNASVQLAVDLGETVKRIDGTEVDLVTPWTGENATPTARARAEAAGLDVPGATATRVRHKAAEDAAEADRDKVEGAGDEEREADAGKTAADEKGQATAPSGDSGEDRTTRDGDAASEAPGQKPGPQAGVAAGPSEGTRPASLDAPRDGKPDDLKQIKGIGPKLEELCNSMGFYHLDQIAAWTEAEVAWVDDNLEGFKGRVSRDEWVEQARVLAKGGETEFSSRVKKGDVY